MFRVQFRKVWNDVSVSDWKDFKEVPPKMTKNEAIAACQLYMCRDFGMKLKLIPAGFSWLDGEGNLWEPEDNPLWQFRTVEE